MERPSLLLFQRSRAASPALRRRPPSILRSTFRRRSNTVDRIVALIPVEYLNSSRHSRVQLVVILNCANLREEDIPRPLSLLDRRDVERSVLGRHRVGYVAEVPPPDARSHDYVEVRVVPVVDVRRQLPRCRRRTSEGRRSRRRNLDRIRRTPVRAMVSAETRTGND